MNDETDVLKKELLDLQITVAQYGATAAAARVVLLQLLPTLPNRAELSERIQGAARATLGRVQNQPSAGNRDAALIQFDQVIGEMLAALTGSVGRQKH